MSLMPISRLLAFDVDEAHVQVAGQMVLHVAVDLDVVQRGLELLP